MQFLEVFINKQYSPHFFRIKNQNPPKTGNQLPKWNPRSSKIFDRHCQTGYNTGQHKKARIWATQEVPAFSRKSRRICPIFHRFSFPLLWNPNRSWRNRRVQSVSSSRNVGNFSFQPRTRLRSYTKSHHCPTFFFHISESWQAKVKGFTAAVAQKRRFRIDQTVKTQRGVNKRQQTSIVFSPGTFCGNFDIWKNVQDKKPFDPKSVRFRGWIVPALFSRHLVAINPRFVIPKVTTHFVF